MSLVGPSLASTNPIVRGLELQAPAFSPASAIWVAFSTYWGNGTAGPSTLAFYVFSTGGDALLPSTWATYYDDQLDAFLPSSTQADLIVQTDLLTAQSNLSVLSTAYIGAALNGLGALPAQRDIILGIRVTPAEEGATIQIYDRADFSAATGVLLNVDIEDDTENYILYLELDETIVGTGTPGTGFSAVADNSGAPYIIGPISTIAVSTVMDFSIRLAVNGNVYTAYVNGSQQLTGVIPELSTQAGLGFGFGFLGGALSPPSITGVSTFKVTTG